MYKSCGRRKFKFSILEMDEDEEFLFFLFSRVNSFESMYIYVHIYIEE